MNAKVKALSEQARKLTPEERIELIEDLQRSLDPTDPEIDRLNRFPYGIVYTQRGNHIVVLAVAHLHQKPKRWHGNK